MRLLDLVAGWACVCCLRQGQRTTSTTTARTTKALMPALNVSVRRKGKVHHIYCAELLLAPEDKGQDARHVDSIWPLWNMFDFTPDARGASWHPNELRLKRACGLNKGDADKPSDVEILVSEQKRADVGSYLQARA